MLVGELIVVIGGVIFLKTSKIFGIILIVFGFLIMIGAEGLKEEAKSKSKNENDDRDRSQDILGEIGGVDNIDINLSKYGDESQLVVLKNKTICLGHDNYETKKIIDFDAIIKLEIRINDVRVGTAHHYSENKIKEIIESIVVYIHTEEYTEELIFKFNEYDKEEIQVKYNEIIKGLNRFKAILGDVSDVGDFSRGSSVRVSEKSIPEQIREYKELLDIDAITKEEFEMKKKELLSK